MPSETSSRVLASATTGNIREICAPTAAVGSFDHNYVLAHRRCSNPLALRMLESVPTGTGIAVLSRYHNMSLLAPLGPNLVRSALTENLPASGG